MQENDIITTKIDGFSNLGYGISHVEGMVIFVEGACPEDEVEIKITKVKKNFANAKVTKILKPSPYRIEPICPMHKVCGSCQLGFIDYDYQLQLKKQVVQDSIQRIGGLSIDIKNPIPSPKTMHYRQKTQYPVSQTKASKKILAGYYKPQSHEIVNIKYCPVQPEICDKIVEFIREKSYELKISGYEEKTHSGDLRHIVIRCSDYYGNCLVTLVINRNQKIELSDKIYTLAKAIFENFEQVTGVCVNYNNKRTNVILGDYTECLIGLDYVEEKLLDKFFKIGSNTFFQINPQSAENIFQYVKSYIKNNFDKPVILDSYAGISAFGITVSDTAKYVVSVEENKKSCELAKECLLKNNISNVEIVCMDSAEFASKDKRVFDVVIIDPPRKGCSTQSLDETYRLCKDTIIYVSCNPATLARDLKYLTEKGAKVESIQPFDMFCHTYHIENVAIIKV